MFWVMFAINVIDILLAPALFLVATLAAAVCGFGIKTTLDKRWGIPLIIMGAVSIVIMIPAGLFVLGMPMVVSGLKFYTVLENLDKAYHAYLKTGTFSDHKGQ